MRRLVLLALLLACGLFLREAPPARASTTIYCGLLATCTCTMTAPSSINFGVYDPFGSTDATVSGTVSVTCTSFGVISGGVSYEIHLTAGSSGSFAARKMNPSAGGGQATYNIYKDSGYATVMGDGTGSSGVYSYTCSIGLLGLQGGCVANFNYYGRVPFGQSTLAPGTFTDTLVWSFNY
ncbi:spore coat U domain-containing protein [Zavarzinia sp.]|uniref:Csu type fimbrial protein n=1 Tax=Zavarzinia sp. TaxID=2027920 RepID=UPI003564D83C